MDALRKIGFFLLLQRLHIASYPSRTRPEDHTSIVRAIITGDPVAAAETMRAHVTAITEWLAEYR